MKFQKALVLVTLQLGLVAAGWTVQGKTFTQADLEKVVAELDKVIPHNAHFKYPIQCTLVDKPDVNAYATALKEGSDLRATMVVYTGLAKGTNNDVRLIRACVAHELTHLSRGHTSGTVPAASDLTTLWTRQMEYDADKYGAEALVKAGYAKKDMIDLLLFLDRDQGRNGMWLSRLTADHADPKARAAELADDPKALKALMFFDTGLAYEDARSHLYAKKLFDAAALTWPALTEAHTNSAKCALMFYYDNLPVAVRNSWWRPDFGPLITTPHAAPAQAVEVTDEDREKWKDALEAANIAVSKNPDSSDAQEILALTQVLEPDAKKDVVQKGVDWFKAAGAKATNDSLKLRYANNAGVGFQRTGDLDSAYASIITAQKGTTTFNSALGENLGLVVVKGRSKEDDTLAANVLFTWLGDTPGKSPRWKTVKKTFDDICAQAGLTSKAIPEKPTYLCQVTTLVTSNKELGILLPVGGLKSLLGEPEKTVLFSDEWKDLNELHWHNDDLTIFTEREKVMRLTSYEQGAYLVLKPVDSTLSDTFQIKVGMTKAQLTDILPLTASVTKDLAQGGKLQTWNYFPGLGMGVLIENDVVKGITVSPVVAPE